MPHDLALRRAAALLLAADSYPFATPAGSRNLRWWTELLHAQLERVTSATAVTVSLGGAAIAMAGLIRSEDPQLALARLSETLGMLVGREAPAEGGAAPWKPDVRAQAELGRALVQRAITEESLVMACKGFVQFVNARGQDAHALHSGAMAIAALAGFRTQLQGWGDFYSMRWPDGTHDTEALYSLLDQGDDVLLVRSEIFEGLQRAGAAAAERSKSRSGESSVVDAAAESRARAVMRAQQLVVAASPADPLVGTRAFWSELLASQCRSYAVRGDPALGDRLDASMAACALALYGMLAADHDVDGRALFVRAFEELPPYPQDLALVEREEAVAQLAALGEAAQAGDSRRAAQAFVRLLVAAGADARGVHNAAIHTASLQHFRALMAAEPLGYSSRWPDGTDDDKALAEVVQGLGRADLDLDRVVDRLQRAYRRACDRHIEQLRFRSAAPVMG